MLSSAALMHNIFRRIWFNQLAVLIFSLSTYSASAGAIRQAVYEEDLRDAGPYQIWDEVIQLFPVLAQQDYVAGLSDRERMNLVIIKRIQERLNSAETRELLIQQSGQDAAAKVQDLIFIDEIIPILDNLNLEEPSQVASACRRIQVIAQPPQTSVDYWWEESRRIASFAKYLCCLPYHRNELDTIGNPENRFSDRGNWWATCTVCCLPQLAGGFLYVAGGVLKARALFCDWSIATEEEKTPFLPHSSQ